jgi:hypothetical protein
LEPNGCRLGQRIADGVLSTGADDGDLGGKVRAEHAGREARADSAARDRPNAGHRADEPSG